MNTTAEKLEKLEKLDVGDNVIKKLGTPPNFLKAKSINVFGNFHRVNIYVNIDANNEERIIKRSSIAYSYLVEADKAGNILDSRPEIVKLFE